MFFSSQQRTFVYTPCYFVLLGCFPVRRQPFASTDAIYETNTPRFGRTSRLTQPTHMLFDGLRHGTTMKCGSETSRLRISLHNTTPSMLRTTAFVVLLTIFTKNLASSLPFRSIVRHIFVHIDLHNSHISSHRTILVFSLCPDGSNSL